MYGIDFTTFDNAFWRAVGADTEKIFNLCDRIRQFLQKGDAVKIISAPGVELNFRIGDRRINRDDGVICDEDLASGDRTANLPFGEVYVAPLEETVCGEVLYPVVYCKAQEVKNLRLRFENGRLVHSSAESNHELFSESFSRNTGDKDRIGEFGIGTNHEVSGVTGCVLLDEKIFGSVHLALGENRSYGGVNSSDLHWDMVIPKPEVYIDGQLFLKDGKFMV
jgi:aminopeptidase